MSSILLTNNLKTQRNCTPKVIDHVLSTDDGGYDGDEGASDVSDLRVGSTRGCNSLPRRLTRRKLVMDFYDADQTSETSSSVFNLNTRYNGHDDKPQIELLSASPKFRRKEDKSCQVSPGNGSLARDNSNRNKSPRDTINGVVLRDKTSDEQKEKRLRVRSHLTMSDGIAYIEDSDWEMSSDPGMTDAPTRLFETRNLDTSDPIEIPEEDEPFRFMDEEEDEDDDDETIHGGDDHKSETGTISTLTNSTCSKDQRHETSSIGTSCSGDDEKIRVKKRSAVPSLDVNPSSNKNILMLNQYLERHDESDQLHDDQLNHHQQEGNREKIVHEDQKSLFSRIKDEEEALITLLSKEADRCNDDTIATTKRVDPVMTTTRHDVPKMRNDHNRGDQKEMNEKLIDSNKTNDEDDDLESTLIDLLQTSRKSSTTESSSSTMVAEPSSPLDSFVLPESISLRFNQFQSSLKNQKVTPLDHHSSSSVNTAPATRSSSHHHHQPLKPIPMMPMIMSHPHFSLNSSPLSSPLYQSPKSLTSPIRDLHPHFLMESLEEEDDSVNDHQEVDEEEESSVASSSNVFSDDYQKERSQESMITWTKLAFSKTTDLISSDDHHQKAEPSPLRHVMKEISDSSSPLVNGIKDHHDKKANKDKKITDHGSNKKNRKESIMSSGISTSSLTRALQRLGESFYLPSSSSSQRESPNNDHSEDDKLNTSRDDLTDKTTTPEESDAEILSPEFDFNDLRKKFEMPEYAVPNGKAQNGRPLFDDNPKRNGMTKNCINDVHRAVVMDIRTESSDSSHDSSAGSLTPKVIIKDNNSKNGLRNNSHGSHSSNSSVQSSPSGHSPPSNRTDRNGNDAWLSSIASRSRVQPIIISASEFKKYSNTRLKSSKLNSKQQSYRVASSPSSDVNKSESSLSSSSAKKESKNLFIKVMKGFKNINLTKS